VFAYDVEINGRTRHIAIDRAGGEFMVAIDGRPFEVSASQVDAQTLSLLVRPGGGFEGGRRSFEVSIAPDSVSGQLIVRVGDATMVVGLNGRRRSGGRDEAAHQAAGPQRLVAPMPGKVVRVLVRSGEVVRPRQPLVVVEAMKMENELRAGRSGTVAEVHAREGSSVDAGALLVVIQ
jgi:biotin carboxyl carrier protein